MPKEEKFVQIIKEHEGILFKITTIYTDNGDDQKDLYQDIVFQLWNDSTPSKMNQRLVLGCIVLL